MEWCASGKYLATGSEDNKTIIWDIEKGASISTFSDNSSTIHHAMFHPTKEEVLFASGKQIMQRDIQQKTPKMKLKTETPQTHN